MAPSTQFELAQPPSDAISAVAFAPETPTRLLVASWDKNVYLYETHTGDAEGGSLLQTIEHKAPVLNVCFGADDDEAFSGGLDWDVNRIDLSTGEKTTISKHGAGVRCVAYSRSHSILVSAAWDSKLHFHDMKSPTDSGYRIMPLSLPGKAHAISVSATKVVVAMTSRLVYIYDLDAVASALASGAADVAAWQQRESSLKFLTRAVSCMPSDAGYATSSIEGRVAVEWFEDSPESQARKYAFKCHRQPAPDGGDIVFPVNALAFHPVYGTFASGGGDGTVALWDAGAKRRMKQYQKFPSSVAAVAFSCDGRYLAVGVCPGFETGMEDYTGEGKTQVFIRELSDSEAKGKGSK